MQNCAMPTVTATAAVATVVRANSQCMHVGVYTSSTLQSHRCSNSNSSSSSSCCSNSSDYSESACTEQTDERWGATTVHKSGV
jgi:hypothetical protein